MKKVTTKKEFKKQQQQEQKPFWLHCDLTNLVGTEPLAGATAVSAGGVSQAQLTLGETPGS